MIVERRRQRLRMRCREYAREGQRRLASAAGVASLNRYEPNSWNEFALDRTPHALLWPAAPATVRSTCPPHTDCARDIGTG